MMPKATFTNMQLFSKSVTLNIKNKLFLVSLFLLIIPITGYQSIQDLENHLRKNQEQDLLEYARLIAESIKHNTLKPHWLKSSKSIDTKRHLFIRPLRADIQFDGYATGDWTTYPERVMLFSDDSKKEKTDPLSFKLQTGYFNRYLYLFIQVNDKHVIYRKPNSNKININDHIILGLENKKGKLVRYVFSSHSPGYLSARFKRNPRSARSAYTADDRINAVWNESNTGYNVEIRIPVSMTGDRLALTVADVDSVQNRKVTATLGISDPDTSEAASTISIASRNLNDYLEQLSRHSTRIWMADNNARVLALSGQLIERDISDEDTSADIEITFAEFIAGIVRLFYQAILAQPASQFQDDLSTASQLAGEEINSALKGTPATQWRQTSDKKINILTAAYPLILNNRQMGIIAVEETSHSILILQNQAFEILINLSILAFIIASSSLLFFASRLTTRIRRLRDDSTNAINKDGRVSGEIKTSHSSDEIGDLTRSMSGMLDRLGQYNSYLETMAGKLSHELRTPVTVVKSSLENIELANPKGDVKTYTRRALDGIDRLGNIITRMSEATRLEQTLQSETPEDYNLETVISEFVGSYSSTFSDRPCRLEIIKPSDTDILVTRGSPELLAQLLEKLLSNARDFSPPGEPIDIKLEHHSDSVFIDVINYGSQLPESIETTLFSSMVSKREGKSEEPHLGLGLYIVRLITEFHKGDVSASNLADKSGVKFRVTLPLVNS